MWLRPRPVKAGVVTDVVTGIITGIAIDYWFFTFSPIGTCEGMLGNQLRYPPLQKAEQPNVCVMGWVKTTDVRLLL